MKGDQCLCSMSMFLRVSFLYPTKPLLRIKVICIVYVFCYVRKSTCSKLPGNIFPLKESASLSLSRFLALQGRKGRKKLSRIVNSIINDVLIDFFRVLFTDSVSHRDELISLHIFVQERARHVSTQCINKERGKM